MPVYQVATSGIMLTKEQRDTLAKRFTAVHHEVTDAAEPLIRIVFQPMPLGLIYTAGEIAPSFILSARCRAGRSEASRDELLHRLYDVIQGVTDLLPDQIVVALTETPTSSLMEAGMITLEPTQKAEAAGHEQPHVTFLGKYESCR